MPRHYLDFSDLSADECAATLAAAGKGGAQAGAFVGRQLFAIFEKPSTRTRASFAAAVGRGGGQATELAATALQTQRGETTADTARALSQYADWLVLRVHSHETLRQYAQSALCPVVNALSDRSHPCQALADVLTCQELRGSLRGRVVAWFGDCNNVLYSWSQAAAMFGCELRVCCPPPYRKALPAAGEFYDSPQAAATGADFVMTDVWTSMGDQDAQKREQTFAAAGCHVGAELMRLAKKEALFMHCLPAHRGREVAAEVLDGAQSAVWTQAKNRLKAQAALLQFLLEAN